MENIMTTQASSKMNRFKSAYLAAALFYLAGFIEMVTSLLNRGSMSMNIALGGMFIAIGAVWTGIGAKHRKEAEQDRTQDSL
jgi:hypothetical protein